MMAQSWLNDKAGTERGAEETGKKRNLLQSGEKDHSHKSRWNLGAKAQDLQGPSAIPAAGSTQLGG